MASSSKNIQKDIKIFQRKHMKRYKFYVIDFWMNTNSFASFLGNQFF